jgi:catechol 2,3-dioxygenase-like lactoylglutathione lyase family enzyme
LDLRRTGDDAFPVSPGTYDQVALVVDGQITELRDATDRDEALCAIPSAPPSPLGPRSAITSATAVLPVRDVRAALEHYRRLGFTVHAYEGGGYGFVERDNIEVHPGEIPDLDPSANPAAVYFFVADADALHAEWRVANGGGQLIEPTDTDYGMREGAHIDDDGNRIRFGAPLHH